MPTYKYSVQLDNLEIEQLKQIVNTGKHSANESTHARILLRSNTNATVREISEELGVSQTTISTVRKLYTEGGLDRALKRKTRLSDAYLSKIDGEFEAKVIATALSPAPEGRARWTLRLLAEHCIENKYIVTISHTAIGDMLNSNEVKPHLDKYWCIPKASDPRFVCNMETVLKIYAKEYNKEHPVI